MRKTSGFTLIELMVSLTVMTILLTVGVPGFQDFTKSHRLNSSVNTFVAALHLTRSEAIKRGGRVTLCKSSTLSTCTTTGGWEQGWIVFSDQNGTAGVMDTGDNLIHTFPPIGANPITIRGNTFVKDRVSFLGSGIVEPNNGTLIFCDDRVKNFASDKGKARAVIISKIGRIRTITGADRNLSETITSCTPN